jgi:hypothetical protein
MGQIALWKPFQFFLLGISHLYISPPPPGGDGTAILPEYIHCYGYYYQVIVHLLDINLLINSH